MSGLFVIPGRLAANAATRGRPPKIDSDRILDVAAGHASGDLSVSAVARELGVAVSTIFGHFEHKDAMLAALLARELARRPVPEDADWRVLVRWLGMTVFEILVANPALAKMGPFLLRTEAPSELFERLCAAMAAQGVVDADMGLAVNSVHAGAFWFGAGSALGPAPAPALSAPGPVILRVLARPGRAMQTLMRAHLELVIEAIEGRSRP